MSPPQLPPPTATPPLQLGVAADLLRGLRPVWSDPARGLEPFFTPGAQPFQTFDLTTATAAATSDLGWSGPALSLHVDVGSLLNALFDYRVLPFAPHSPEFDIPARALLLPPERRDASLASLGAFLGLDLVAHTATGGGFVLLKMRRVVADHRHEAAASGLSRHIRIDHYWTAEARNAMGRLRVARRIVHGPDREAVVSEIQSGRYLDYFQRFGTHFVTRVELGELLLQVFAIYPARFPALRDLWQRETGGGNVTGASALGFRPYLGPGWVAARSRIVSVGDNPAVAASLAAGAWHDAEFVGGDSLLAPLTGQPAITRTLASVTPVPVPIALDFAPQSSFMEVFRADAWKRLLKGALLQRFGPAIRIPPARLPSPQPVPTRTLPRGELRLADTLLRFDTVAEYRAGAPLQLRGRHVRLSAYRVHADPPAGEWPVIRLEEAALDDFEFIAGIMHGALFVVESASGRRETICEGFRFITDPANPGRVALRGAPSAEEYRPLDPLIESASAWMAALLRQPAAADFARGFFEWRAAFLADDSTGEAARARALHLAQVKDHSGEMRPHSSIESTTLLALARDVAARALRARIELRDPETAPATALQACASDFAHLSARAEKLLVDASLSSPNSAGDSASESPQSTAQIHYLREQGRLLEALLRLITAQGDTGSVPPPPGVFDLLTAADALITATPANTEAPSV